MICRFMLVILNNMIYAYVDNVLKYLKSKLNATIFNAIHGLKGTCKIKYNKMLKQHQGN